jgi:hypothetical protein
MPARPLYAGSLKALIKALLVLYIKALIKAVLVLYIKALIKVSMAAAPLVGQCLFKDIGSTCS